MTKKKPINLRLYYKRNPFDWKTQSDFYHRFEQEERIKLASMLSRDRELRSQRYEDRRRKETARRTKITKFLISIGGMDMLLRMNRFIQYGIVDWVAHPFYLQRMKDLPELYPNLWPSKEEEAILWPDDWEFEEE